MQEGTMLTLPAKRADRADFPTSQDIKALPYHGPAPRQVAVPVHAESVAQVRNGQEGLSYTQHLLRRKTPRGPIFDAYDSTPTDPSIHMPATKHVLVSTPSQGSEQPPRPFARNGPVSSTEHDDVDPRRRHEGIKNRDTTEDFGYATRQDYRPSWDFPGGLDSVLNQTLPLHPSQRYYLQYGSTIPTVLPATMQAHMGPTASARPELYGPYWPDGTYNPYRPAPVRDDRFYGRSLRHPPQGNHPSLHAPYPARPHYFSSPPLDSGYFQTDNAPPIAVHPYSQVAPFYDGGKGIDLPSGQSHVIRRQDSLQAHLPQPTEWHDEFHASRPTFLPTSESNHMAFRDKTFAWAHRIYVDLLATVHQSRKQNPLQYKMNSHYKSASKPVIYPRPPKRSGSHCLELSKNERPIVYGTRPSAYPQHGSATNSSSEAYDLQRPPTAIFSPSRRGSDQVNDLWPVQDSRPHLQSFSNHYNDKIRANRRTSDSAVGHDYTPQIPHSQYSDAIAALGMIETLCNESNGGWIDGMLLAGCLAYGLGEYDQALAWYQSVLQNDNKHVEAMSNLAATLLALNRREEALNHWSVAVKLRPSYFEAVEHLIGLLCSDHRAKEAVAMIELVEKSLRIPFSDFGQSDPVSDADSETKSRSSSINTVESLEKAHFDHEQEDFFIKSPSSSDQQTPGFGLGGFAISGADNGRMLALIHAKGNMLYALGDNRGAAKAFEDAILLATGYRQKGIRGLICRILTACLQDYRNGFTNVHERVPNEPILLSPERALQTAKNMFYPSGALPGLEFVAQGIAQKAAISTTSNSLLSLAKIYQDGMSSASTPNGMEATAGTRDILALYYLSLSLQQSPSTANNVGILLASVQQSIPQRQSFETTKNQISNIPGVVPGSGIALALAYYNYGLNLDQNHAHLYTNLGSLLKDIGQLNAAIKMYEMAVKCDGNFDIALANLANAVKDQGRVADAISFYRRAVQANPEFAEAVCGLATALNSVCGWHGRGGIYADHGRRDRIHVNEHGMMFEGRTASGWVSRVVEIVEKQLKDGESWGIGTLSPAVIDLLCQQLTAMQDTDEIQNIRLLRHALQSWSGKNWEGSRVVRLIERAIRRIGWQWYQDRYKYGKDYPVRRYTRPTLPASLTSPNAPTVLPFHTFTAPLSAKQIRQISQRNGLRISVSTLRSTWLPSTVYPPPEPPRPHLNVGYVSSDFNNHPLAHLMQSVFGLHDRSRVRAFCYATTSSDGSVHRRQIEREAPVFYDASSWSIEKLVKQIVKDGIHILVNLNGYTRGARNEVFAARPAPIHMSFMGFAGTLGAEWCDYILADSISIPPETLSPWRRNVDVNDRLNPEALAEDSEGWVYSENIIFTKDTFFCVDHKQSAPDAKDGPRRTDDRRQREKMWEDEQDRRWRLRKEIFPALADNAVILGNFNQLYKIDPSIFRVYLRILASVPNAILWLLRFPDLGEKNLMAYARDWAGPEIASRIVFTDVAPKGTHITRASVVDLFLDTPECNAHTTAADVVWSGTPIVTWGKWKYKMCSRMAGSIVGSALPLGRVGDDARVDLLVKSEEHYEEQAVKLAQSLKYPVSGDVGRGRGRLMELRRILWEGRWTSRLFDTKRWVRDVERAYWEAWGKWESGEGGDIWL
jgi:predicted O-linked N-acetylglucosamine transferase (SPINDLY family)